MKVSLIVSSKGQITLPAAMRRELGLAGNAIVTAERQDGRIVLTPAIVLETEQYSAADIAGWVREDRFSGTERAAVIAKLKRPSKRTPSTNLKPKANLKPAAQRAPRRRA